MRVNAVSLAPVAGMAAMANDALRFRIDKRAVRSKRKRRQTDLSPPFETVRFR